jgi:hypothetical protein
MVLSKADTKTRQFEPTLNEIHTNEKWFYMDKNKQWHLWYPGIEAIPKRSVQHKSHIQKVMFLCAIGTPQEVGDYFFDGKIGIWAFVDKVFAQRSSKNRVAGTMEMKPVLNVNAGLVF